MKAFFAGLTTGVALGVLFTPRSGEQTRERVRDKANEWSAGAREQFGRVAEKAQRAGSQVAETVQSVASKAGVGLLARLNTATRDELMVINGIGPVTADKIIAGRPYTSARQVVEQGIVPEPIFQALSREFEAA